jgi:OPA family glycerol-3-phosphate transporter-like MFS transporter/OPA family sugar phosphate sensor protein UhpC-like MFS transporter
MRSWRWIDVGETVIGHSIDVTCRTSTLFPIVAGLCAASDVLPMQIEYSSGCVARTELTSQ